MTEPPPELPARAVVELPTEALVRIEGQDVSPDADDQRPSDPHRDSALHAMRRMEDGLNRVVLILFGLFVVETLSSLCLLFIIVYSLTVN